MFTNSESLLNRLNKKDPNKTKALEYALDLQENRTSVKILDNEVYAPEVANKYIKKVQTQRIHFG